MKSIILLILALSVTAICFAQSNHTETLTITTYYPAPYGVYRNLKLSPTNVIPSGSALTPGVMFFNNNTGTIQYYNNTHQWVNMEGASSGDPLTHALHNKSNCTNHVPPGRVMPTDVGFSQCQFDLPSCPSGWTQYNTWSTRAASSCSCGIIYCRRSYPTSGACTNAAKAWGSAATPAPCTYSGTCGQCTCCDCGCPCPLGAVTQIGCY